MNSIKPSGTIGRHPKVTLALFTYNQQRFVREAVKSVLGQGYSNLEIIVSDDFSTDSTFDIIRAVVKDYSGPHSVIVNRNQRNLGLASHFNSIVDRATGEIVVVAAGDDVALPGRVSKTVDALTRFPDASFVSFTDVVIDENGHPIDSLPTSKPLEMKAYTLSDFLSRRTPQFSGASRGFRKNVYAFFGDLEKECPTEDTPYLLRGLMLGRGIVSPDPGIKYRRHSSNLSGSSSIHAMDFAAIQSQYLRDVGFAVSSGAISKTQSHAITRFADRNFRRRLLRKELHETSNFFATFLLKVLPARELGLREKAGILRKRFLKGGYTT